MKANITSFRLARSAKNGSQDFCDAQICKNSLIAVMADGVGDAEFAREAAVKVVESMINNFKSRPATWTIQKALDEFAWLINQNLYQESLARFERPEMLSTLSVVAIEGEKLFGLNVGDSPVFFHNGNFTQLSADHAENSAEMKHVLTRAMGMSSGVVPHYFEKPVAPGDVILLCTDGVSNLLSREELQSFAQQRVSARTIVAAAREKATPETLDDMSATVIEIVETDKLQTSRELDVPETLKAGDVVDGFTLVRPLNQNERAWLAKNDSGSIVLKFAPREARQNDAMLNQFMKEIWNLMRLKADFFIHAFIPENGRTLCYAMEYVEAPTLQEVIRTAPLKIDEAIALAKFLLEACQFLVALDVVHGDLKPENILVLKQGKDVAFKLIDFGSVGEIFSVTSRAGTPSYLAPERFHATPISERTEIFSIGVILYQSLTGVFPFGEIEPFQTPTFRAPKKLSLLNPNVPPWFESVISKAISARAEERYLNFSEMKFDLENPNKVAPYFSKNAPLLERNPILFYKIGFFVLLLLNLYLLSLLASR